MYFKIRSNTCENRLKRCNPYWQVCVIVRDCVCNIQNGKYSAEIDLIKDSERLKKEKVCLQSETNNPKTP